MSSAAPRAIDELLERAGLAAAEGVQVVGGHRLASVAFDPSLPLIVLRAAGEPGEALPGRHARTGARAVLAALYPATHSLTALASGSVAALGDVEEAALLKDDWFVPALDPIDNLGSPHGMAAISARLRAPDGCPWDRRQTHLTLRPHLLEEAYETIDAIEHGSPDDLADELGDILLQVILHAQLAAEEGVFDLTDVYRSIAGKIVRRHPHVFGSVEVDGVEQVLTNWETIKAGERAERGKEADGAFGGVARVLPALPGSREIQERASALGWDWEAIDGVWEKVGEELDELRVAASDDERLHELGDVLFALVNLSRWMKVDPEEALRAANHRWVARYRSVERLAAERGLDLGAMSLEEKDRLWDEVKAGVSGPRRVAIVVHAVVPGDPRVRRQGDALIEAGHEVDVIALRQPGETPREIEGAMRIIRLPINRRFVGFAGHLAEYVAFAALATWRLAREHRMRRYDLVQVATVPDFLGFAALPEKLAGVPLLLDLHEDMPEFLRDRFAHPGLRLLQPIVDGSARAAAALADELITVHEPLRQLSIARGVAPERISVVMNSADGRLFDPARYERRPFMHDGALRLIHHSSLQRIYGLDGAIEGLARLRPDLRWRLDVYGEGPWRAQIEAAIARTGTGARVTLHGNVPMDDLPRLIAAADIGLVPSLAEPYLQYSLSTKLLEYAAMGIPTVATDLATFRHHFGDTALRFVPGDDPQALARAVEGLADDPPAAVAMGREAQHTARAYDWDAQKRHYISVVERLAAGRRAG